MKKGILLAVGLSTILMADPLATAPGTKARAMGGAFTAIANNTSALYFNPAGFVVWEDSQSGYNAGTAELGQALSLNGQEFDTAGSDIFADDYTNFFFATSEFDRDSGWGVGVYSLYSLKLPYTVGATSRYLEQENKLLTWAYSYKLTDSLYEGGGKISIGASVSYAWTDDFFSDEEYGDEGSNVAAKGLLWGLGLKARLLQSENFNLDIGVNYRAESHFSAENTYFNGGIEDLVPWEIPEELDLGVAVTIPTELANVTLAYDRKEVGYASATSPNVDSGETATSLAGMGDITTNAFGAEIAFEMFQLRGGFFKDTADTGTTAANTLEGKGVSGGLGITTENGWNLEAAMEKRTLTAVNKNLESENTYFSLSANKAF